jgi:hypothetical protein
MVSHACPCRAVLLLTAHAQCNQRCPWHECFTHRGAIVTKVAQASVQRKTRLPCSTDNDCRSVSGCDAPARPVCGQRLLNECFCVRDVADSTVSCRSTKPL